MSKTSCAARCSRGSVQGVFRAPAEGEGGVAHREDLAATASATLERSAGTVAHGKRAARERRRRRSKVSRRRRAGRAPWEARARAARVQTAGEDLLVVVVVRTPTRNYLRLASPDRGKYFLLFALCLVRVFYILNFNNAMCRFIARRPRRRPPGRGRRGRAGARARRRGARGPGGGARGRGGRPLRVPRRY